MARVAVTYEQVAAVANALYAQGIKDPGTKAIREELAKRVGPGGTTGSPNTIQGHLNQWRVKDRPADPGEPAPQLPPGLAADIGRALNAAASVARERVEEKLAQVQAELGELVAAGEGNELRIDELSQELAVRTSERDSMAGQLAQRTAEVAELKAGQAGLQEKTSTLERELHAAQADAQAANGRVDEIRASTEKQLSKLQGELDRERVVTLAANDRTVNAEMRAAGAEARLEGERAANQLLEERLSELKAVAARLEADASRAGSADAAAQSLRDQVRLLAEHATMLADLLRQHGVANVHATPAAPPASGKPGAAKK